MYSYFKVLSQLLPPPPPPPIPKSTASSSQSRAPQRWVTTHASPTYNDGTKHIDLVHGPKQASSSRRAKHCKSKEENAGTSPHFTSAFTLKVACQPAIIPPAALFGATTVQTTTTTFISRKRHGRWLFSSDQQADDRACVSRRNEPRKRWQCS